MQTVRLPIFNENGTESGSYLEIKAEDLISTVAMRGRIAKVVDPFEQNLRTLGILMPEEITALHVAEDEPESTPVVEEWRVIESLPIRSFEINQYGVVRHRASKAIMPQEFDIDQGAYRTLLTINGLEMSVYGTYLADAMWDTNT